MQRSLRSRSVHNFGTCDWRTAAQWQKMVFPASKHLFPPQMSPLRSGSPNACPAVVQRPRSQSPQHFDIRNLQQIHSKNNFLALGVCFPQPCSSSGRRFAASRSRVQNYQRIVSFPQHKFPMKNVVNWMIPLRILLVHEIPNSTLKVKLWNDSPRKALGPRPLWCGCLSLEFLYLFKKRELQLTMPVHTLPQSGLHLRLQLLLGSLHLMLLSRLATVVNEQQ